MNISNTYECQQNKGLLWNVLMENNYFDGLGEYQFKKIVSLFEQKIIQIKNNIQPTDTIINLNKKTINEMVKCISEEKNQYSGSNDVYKVKDIQNKRRTELNDNYNKKQEEFNSMFKKKPKEIDFSDKHDDMNNNDIDAKLSEIIKKRKLDLVFKDEDISKANNWFNNTNKSELPQTDYLNIGENLDTKQEIQPILINSKNNDNRIRNKNKVVSFENESKKNNTTFQYFMKNLKQFPSENQSLNVKEDSPMIKEDSPMTKEDYSIIKSLKEQIESLHNTITILKDTIQVQKSKIIMKDKSTNTETQTKINNKLVSSLLVD